MFPQEVSLCDVRLNEIALHEDVLPHEVVLNLQDPVPHSLHEVTSLPVAHSLVQDNVGKMGSANMVVDEG